MKSLVPFLCCGLLVTSFVSTNQTFAQDEPHDQGHEMAAEEDEEFGPPRRQESLLMWTFNALGWRYTFALPLAGLLSFVLALVVVMRGGNYAGPALLFIVPLPALVGLLGVVDGITMSTMVLTQSEATAKPSDVLTSFGSSVVTLLVGMLLMGPAYLVAMGGLFIRTLMGEKPAPVPRA